MFCSDTHLRRDSFDTFFAFTQLIDTAIQHKIPVFGAGDLLDKQSNRAETVVFLAKELRRLAEHDLLFYYTQGQHEFDVVPWLEIADNAVYCHKKSVRLGDKYTLYGLDWQPHGKLQEELAAIPSQSSILLCHQVWSDWMGTVASPQGEMAQIPGHIKYVFTGDLHQWRLEKTKNADGISMTAVSCGATTKQKITEPDTHHYALFYPDGRVEKQTLRSRVSLKTHTILTPEDLDSFVAGIGARLAAASQRAAAMELPDNMTQPYLRVVFNPTVLNVVKRVEACVGDQALIYFKQIVPDDQDGKSKKTDQTKAGLAVTPLSLLDQEIDKEETPETYDLAEVLLTAAASGTDVEVAFAKWRAAYLED